MSDGFYGEGCVQGSGEPPGKGYGAGSFEGRGYADSSGDGEGCAVIEEEEDEFDQEDKTVKPNTNISNSLKD